MPSEPPFNGGTPASPIGLPSLVPNVTRELPEALRNTAAMARQLIVEVERAIVGKRDVLELIVCGLLANGHVLLDDLPGVAKTLAARSIATAAGLQFSRIQFTPDLLPADVTGGMVLDLATNQPSFRPGPVFAQLLLADEINRAPAKTQSALLEAMQERQVTADGQTYRLPGPFLVIATQNPIESEGTYPLPEAQLDRFILRTAIGYPAPASEHELLRRRLERRHDDVEINPILRPADIIAMQQAIELVHVDERIVKYIVDIVNATRAARDLQVGASPRGGLALIKLSRAAGRVGGARLRHARRCARHLAGCALSSRRAYG